MSAFHRIFSIDLACGRTTTIRPVQSPQNQLQNCVTEISAASKNLRVRLKIPRGAVFEQRAGWRGVRRYRRFPTCCIADFQIGWGWRSGARSSGGRHAGLETRDTAGLETCGTTTGHSHNLFTVAVSGCAPFRHMHLALTEISFRRLLFSWE
jgi:hypothetical protein